jgi:hypothetical protein
MGEGERMEREGYVKGRKMYTCEICPVGGTGIYDELLPIDKEALQKIELGFV